MQGGGSGKVIEPGDAENSTLFLVITHKEEPKMPPNSPKIPDAEIELIRKWIDGGALENSGSKAVARPSPSSSSSSTRRRSASRPERRRCPRISRPSRSCRRRKPSAVVAMAASPWAPLVAVAGHKQVLALPDD